MRNFYLVGLFLAFVATNLQAQTAKIQGRVFKIEKNVETPIPYAKVMILKPDSTVFKGATTDFDGKFVLLGTPGKVLMKVRADEMKDSIFTINLVEGENPEMVFQMFDLVTTVATIVVKGEQKKEIASVQGEDNRRKDEVTTSDGMSREQITKTGDSQMGAVVQKIPGVSVEDGKYVYVRGLGDRYVKTVLNGVEIPGLDPDRNTVQLDIFPAATIGNVVIYKTFSPNLSGDFTGGLIDVITRDYPNQKELKVNFGLGYNSATTFNNQFIGYQGGKFDFLGFDDGTRALPISPSAKTYDPSLNDVRTTTMTKAFNPVMAFEQKTAMPNLTLGFSYGNYVKKLFGSEKWTYGYISSFNYRNTNSLNEIPSFGNYLRSQDVTKTELETFRVSNGVVAQNDVLWTGMFNQTFVYNQKHKYSVGFFHTQNGTSSASSIRENNIEGNQAVLIKQGLQYTQRRVTNLDIKGGHTYVKWKINWVVAPTLSSISDPDLRSTVLEEVTTYNSNGERMVSYEMNQAVGSQIRRIYRDLNEKSINSKLNFTYQFNVRDSVKSKLEFGIFNVSKQRDFNVYDYSFEMQNFTTTSLDPNFFFQPENIWTKETGKGLYVRGQKEPANQFVGRQFVSGAYIMNDMPFTSNFSASYGVRLEKSDNFYTGQNNAGTIKYKNENVLNTLNILPAANLVYKFKNKDGGKKDQTNIRASFSETVARPSFREKSIAQIYDPILDRTFNGNIDLVQTKIFNYDLRWEKFFGRTELISASAFYKKLINPIEIATYEQAPNEVRPVNAGEAQVFGLELEARKAIGFTKESQKHLNLTVGANFNYVVSRIDMTKVLINKGENIVSELEIREANKRGDETINRYRPMFGQSPYSVNAFVNFSNDSLGLVANVSYNVQGPRLAVVGIGLIPDVFEQPFHSLNFKVSKTMGKDQQWNLSLTGQNMLNQVRNQFFVSYQAENQVYNTNRPGMTITTAVSYTF